MSYFRSLTDCFILSFRVSGYLVFLLFFNFCYVGASESVLTNEQKIWLENNVSNQIFFAPESDYPPMIWSEYGLLFGVSVDYLDLIEKNINLSFDRRDPRSLNKILEEIKKGEKSIVSSISFTDDRSKYLLFTRPYLSLPAIFVSKKNQILDIENVLIKDLSVSVGDGYGAHEYLRNNFPSIKIKTRDNDFLVIQSLINDEVDIAVLDVASFVYLLKKHDFVGLNKVGNTGYVYKLAFAVPKEFPELRNILDDSVGSISEEDHRLILEKWGINDSFEDDLFKNKKNIVSDEFIFDKTDVILMIVLFVNTFFLFYYVFIRHKGLVYCIPKQKVDFIDNEVDKK